MEKKKKIRADQLLVDQGLAESRSKAQGLIMGGHVYQGTERIDKASQSFEANVSLSVKGKPHPYVGRGGLKLKAALDYFSISVKDQVCLDIGASTGGFTDCLLQEGARKVVALDVGYGQLDWKLQKDERVLVRDRTNFRHITADFFTEPVTVITIDVSFISLDKILPKIKELTDSVFPDHTHLIALIKPQFEVGKEHVGKGGIVKDPEKQKASVEAICSLCSQLNMEVIGVIPSPITGQDGNQEYLLVGIIRTS